MSQSQWFTDTLFSRMHDDLHLTGMSENTRKAYLRQVRKLAEFAQCPPDKLTEDQLRAYFLYLKNDLNFAYGSLRVAFSGIKFFYTITCKRNWDTLRHMRLQNVTTLPEVITIEQVNDIVDAATTMRMAVYFWTVYSLGLRMQEGLNLQTGDVDGKRMQVHVHRGKGAKDRYIPLPSETLHRLREYWKTHRHKRLLFPADGRGHKGMSTAKTPMSPTAVQGAMKKITRKLDFGKKVSIHTLRHSYATHLLEADVSLKAIQEFMGHSSLQTTMIYLHLTDSAKTNARQVIENLFRRRR